MKIYTKTGDHGTTQLQNHCHIRTLGNIDELNARIALVHCANSQTINLPSITEQLLKIQCNLIDIGSIVSKYTHVYPSHDILESWIDTYTLDIEPLRQMT